MKVPALRLNSKAGVPNPKADLYCGRRPPDLIYINVCHCFRTGGRCTQGVLTTFGAEGAVSWQRGVSLQVAWTSDMRRRIDRRRSA
jgi:hypothetical protein